MWHFFQKTKQTQLFISVLGLIGRSRKEKRPALFYCRPDAIVCAKGINFLKIIQ
jgi:hypothetical protein